MCNNSYCLPPALVGELTGPTVHVSQAIALSMLIAVAFSFWCLRTEWHRLPGQCVVLFGEHPNIFFLLLLLLHFNSGHNSPTVSDVPCSVSNQIAPDHRIVQCENMNRQLQSLKPCDSLVQYEQQLITVIEKIAQCMPSLRETQQIFLPSVMC